MPRFVLLEHIGHPDDPAGLHYDLLLEGAEACRTWRLATIPVAGGDAVAAEPLAAAPAGMAGEREGGGLRRPGLCEASGCRQLLSRRRRPA